MSKKLKPCPFCGGKARLIFSRYEVSFIQCEKCNARVDWYDAKLYESKIDIEAWNRRVSND